MHRLPMIVTETTRRRTASLLQSRLLKAVVSAALLAFLLSRIDFRDLGEIISEVQPGLLALGVVIFLMANAASVIKWHMIIEAQGAAVSFIYLTSLFYIGLFFNNFLPTNFGGDVIRAYKLSRVTGRTADAFGSVAVDRLSSVFALLLIASVLALIQLRLLSAQMITIILSMFIACLLLILLLFNRKAAARIGGVRLLRNDPFGLRQGASRFYHSMHDLSYSRKTMVYVFLLSLVYQVLHILTFYFLSLSLGIDVPLFYYFLFVPIALVAGMIPISLNGLGVREGAWIILFGQVGVSAAKAFSVSMLGFLVISFISLAGGILYLFDRGVPSPLKESSNEQS